VPALLGASDLYIHYGKQGNCPVVLLEAARAGVAAMTPPAGGAAEIVTALGAGVLLNLDDLDKTTRSLSRLMTDAAYRRDMGQKARAGFLARFAVDAMAREYIRALQSAGASLASAQPVVPPVRIGPAVIAANA
jgi:glycosyltransferase involved in cell wall biosynthesis